MQQKTEKKQQQHSHANNLRVIQHAFFYYEQLQKSRHKA